MKRRFLILALTCMTYVFAQAQEYTPLSHLNVGLRVSTMGIGVEAATPLNKYFRARAGVDIMTFSTNYFNIELNDWSDDLRNSFGYVPDYRVKGKLGMFHGHLLADFHPMPTGIFHITAGVFLGSTKVTADGYLADSNDNESVLLPGEEWPHLELDGRVIDVTGGRAKVDLQLGLPVKPYVGIGIGRAVTNSRFGFKFELGVLYQGNYTLKQGGHKLDLADFDIDDNGDMMDDIHQYTDWLKLWPMVNFQLTYRIF